MERDTHILGQKIFRAILRAMSQPGTVVPLPGQDDELPVVRLLSALVDNEVNVAVLGTGSAQLGTTIHTRTGCHLTPALDADFIVAAEGSTEDVLLTCKKGTLDYPDEGATVIYMVRELAEQNGALQLRGPGIKDERMLDIQGLGTQEIAKLRTINSGFPLGVDAMLVTPDGQLACLPRSLKLGVM